MFKSKGSLYVLFPLVIIIWGIVIYKVVGVFEDEPENLPVLRTEGVVEVKKITRDTFSLLPVNQDPFLGHYYKKPEKVIKSKALPPKEIHWPQVKYLGLISGTGKSPGVHVLQVNGKQLLIENGDTAEGIKLVNSGTEKVTLLYEGSRKTFSKE